MEQIFSYMNGIRLENLSCGNPFNPQDTLRYYYGIPEMFYLIDFLDIEPNKYIITTYGRVFDAIRGVEMSPQYQRDGHKRIRFTVNGKRKKYSVHRLVAIAFIPKTQEDIILGRDVVNHIDNLPGNNIMWNLEWCTSEENTRDYLYRQKFFKPVMTIEKTKKGQPFGDRVANRTITTEQAHLICQALEQGMSNIECCNYAGIEYNRGMRTIIWNIVVGNTWTEVSSQYNINREIRPQLKRDEYVVQICQLLSNNHTPSQIVDILQMPGNRENNIEAINKIKRRETYPQISKDYMW